MAAPGRPVAAAPSSSPGDEAAVPFSALFDDKSGFDLRSIESTARDQSIFVTPDGRRFRLESLPPESSSSSGAARHSAKPTAQPPALPATTTDARPSAAQTFGALLRNSLRRRPGSNSSPHSPSSPRTGRAAASPHIANQVPPPEAQAPTLRATRGMAQANASNRISATPLYWQSDGGVQAAEALIDPHTPRSPSSLASPASPVPTHSPLSHSQPPAAYGQQPTQIINFNYANYTAQSNYHSQQSHQPSGPITTRLPSLLDHASPVISPRRDSEPYSPLDGPIYDSEKEYLETQKECVETPPYSNYVPSSSSRGPMPNQAGPHGNYVAIGRSYSSGELYDTLTPVVVVDQPSIPHTSSYSSDGASTTRDNVLPGEIILYDGPVKSAQTLNAPVFQDAQLKVFRNTLSNDLRFYCRVGRESESYWIKATNAHLVPVYAYDSRFPNVVYIRDNESERGNLYVQTGPGNGRPSGIYQFARLKDLCDFQAKLTLEKVVLDITSVKLVKLSKDSKSSDTFYTVRLQIWHEAELRRSAQSDVASFVTAGTTLSGPLRERLVPNASRLVIYLGRLGEYITLFITDDIELKAEGPTMVKLKARKASSFSKKGSRWQGIKAHIEKKGNFEMAGLEIHGQAMNPDVDSTYDLYKTFELDFENSPSQDNFIRKWDEVMTERRMQRARLNQIKEEMGQNVYTGQIAREIW